MNDGAVSLRVLSVLPIIGGTTGSKRIAMLQAAGFSVEAVAFEREHHAGRPPTCSVERLGQIADGQYLRRVPRLLAAIPTVRRAIQRSDLVYASGSDMALTALVAGLGTGRPLILEIADLQRVQVAKGVKSWLVRLLDRYVANRCRLLVVTAPGFVDGYYRRRLHTNTPALLLENKLEADGTEAGTREISPRLKGRPLIDRRLRIGYFGILRSDWSWRVLEALASFHPKEVDIVVAGDVTTPADLAERAARLPNVDFRGTFSSPGDLPQLYGDVDLVWACNPSPDADDPNWQWAQSLCRTNRFYESCYFKRPIIAMAGCSDGVEVERHGIGIVLHDHSIEGIWNVLSGITPDRWTEFEASFSRLPRRVYTYTTETEELATVLRSILAARR